MGGNVTATLSMMKARSQQKQKFAMPATFWGPGFAWDKYFFLNNEYF
jgi:hypothetical protein